MKTGIIASLMLSLFVLTLARGVWHSPSFQQLEPKHVESKQSILNASFR